MGFKIIYDTNTEAVRRTLPMSAKASLRMKLNAVAREVERAGDRYSSGSRTLSFGGSNQGVAIYIDTARRLITVTALAWLKTLK